MATVPALTERTEAQRWLEVRDDDGLWGDLRPELREAVRVILETTMEDELAAELVAARYERTPWRTDTRNGAYHRTLVTELGAIIDLRVPRRRLVPYRPSFLERAVRRTTTVDDVLRQAFLRGLSTREAGALAATLTGVPLSAASISRLARRAVCDNLWGSMPIVITWCLLKLPGRWSAAAGNLSSRGAPHASIEPRRRRSAAAGHAMSEPHPAGGQGAWSQAVTDLAPYGPRGPGAGGI
jgi:hypothetical protein